jgi:hypothetical protein
MSRRELRRCSSAERGQKLGIRRRSMLRRRCQQSLGTIGL